MTYKMCWEKLLSTTRERESISKITSYRNSFDIDYQRVISSSSIRRLQDKTQVFPLQENDFTRTRLTHSLEVSSIGSSIGKQVGYLIEDKKYASKEDNLPEKLSSLLAVAGLVHDLGNPPFGHYGETVIKKWFKEHCADNIFEKYSKETMNDFCNFDGNAQTLRILSKLQYMKDCFGMNFCYGTLATLIKYPSNESGKLSHFKSENKLFDKIITETGMKQGDKIYRHPATYLLEAADDIAYLFADLEDAVKKDANIMDKVLEKIKENKDKIFTEDYTHKEFVEEIERFKFEKLEKMPQEDKISTKIMSLRVQLQAYCITKVCEEFIASYKDIMNGNYKNKSLCECQSLKYIIGDEGIIRKLCIKYAYQNNEVLMLELIGDKVLKTLLDNFVPAILSDKCDDARNSCGKFYKLISSNFRFIQHINKDNSYKEKLDDYDKIQLIIDYISGMTDSYALNLHKILIGTKLP